MSRVTTSKADSPAVRAIGWATLALLASGVTAAAAHDWPGAAPPPTSSVMPQFAACASAGPPSSPERALCYRAAANLANERYTLPSLAVGQTADATKGIGSAVGTGVSRSGSATRQ